MDQVDTIIIGAGLAGLACACTLAKADPEKQILVIERGDAPGAKNVSGGRLYLDPIRTHAPAIAEMIDEAAYERAVRREGLTFFAEDAAATVDFIDEKIPVSPPHSVTVLRAKLDAFLAEKATELGAFIVPQTAVTELLKDGKKVIGVKTDAGEEIGAPVVVAADGVLSLIAGHAGLREGYQPSHFALAVKEVLELESGRIEDRFRLAPGEGAATLFAGDLTGHGLLGGGFCYTNQDSLSLGIVIGIGGYSELEDPEKIPDLFERFKSHPEVSRLISDAKLAEYSAHVIPEAPHVSEALLATDGLIVAGDAAGFALNLGITVRGMDFALISGEAAANAIIDCREKDNFSRESLSEYYISRIHKSILGELSKFERMPDFLSNPRLYTKYPQGVTEVLRSLFTIGGEKSLLYQTTWPLLRRYFLNWSGLKDWWQLRKL